MAAKIAIFDDLELLQELRRRRVPERVILAEIMYGLERNHFALVPPGNSNLTNDQTLNLPEDWFPLCPAVVKICALINARGVTIYIDGLTPRSISPGRASYEGLADKVVTPCKIAWFLTCNPERIFVYIFLADF